MLTSCRETQALIATAQMQLRHRTEELNQKDSLFKKLNAEVSQNTSVIEELNSSLEQLKEQLSIAH